VKLGLPHRGKNSLENGGFGRIYNPKRGLEKPVKYVDI
jgi:hypothetical protein